MTTIRSTFRICIGGAFVLFTLMGAPVHAATYYVQTAANGGSNAAGRNGSTAQPWLTVAYAASQVTAAGNSISVGAGTFAETSTINLAAGVSLVGAGYSNTTITTAAATNPGTVGHLLKLVSGTLVNGNQSVANIKFGGKSYTVNQGIEIDRRSNVTLTGLWMENFGMRAVYISNTSVPQNAAPPAGSYLDNIRIVHSTFKNSAQVPPPVWDAANGVWIYTNWGWGSVNAYQVSNSTFRHCTLVESTDAPVPNNVGGFNFKGRWVKGLKIHNCILLQRPHWPNPSRQKGFSIEFQNSLDCDFFDNWCNGSISFSADNSKIHHNTVVMTGEGANEGLEAGGLNTVVASNYVEGAAPALYGGGSGSIGMSVRHNVFRSCGGGVFLYENGPGGSSNLKVYNNTFDLCGMLWNSLEGAVTGRIQGATGTMSNLSIKNNLITNLVGGIRGVALTGTNGGTANAAGISGTVMDRNLYYSVPPGFLLNQGAVNTTNTNNLVGDPLYLGGATVPSPYYRLGAGSPAIGTGVNVGLPYLGANPDKGAFVQDVTTIDATIEAEMNYSVAADVGSTAVNVGNLGADSSLSVNLNDPGDSIRVHFDVLTAGSYNVRVRARSGYDTAPTAYWPNGYTFQMDSAIPVTLTGSGPTVRDPASNVYWGTMSGTVSLTAGRHHLTITTGTGWFGGCVDYVRVK